MNKSSKKNYFKVKNTKNLKAGNIIERESGKYEEKQKRKLSVTEHGHVCKIIFPRVRKIHTQKIL